MKKIGAIGVLLLALAACNTPPLGFMGTEPTRVTIDDSVFDVRIKDGQAHALRLNKEFAPNISFVAGRAATAITQVSGCAIVSGSLAGDPIFITADLDCASTDLETPT
ncbi:MAG: hypothetical protein KC448_06475 [Yoonia sp.]|nr:hypothetical protein [Yoonia sp.]